LPRLDQKEIINVDDVKASKRLQFPIPEFVAIGLTFDTGEIIVHECCRLEINALIVR